MVTVILFYKYVPLENLELIAEHQHILCTHLQLKGRIILACEGVNGTLSGSPDSIDSYIHAMNSDSNFSYTDFKKSAALEHCFSKLAITIKPTIVNMGDQGHSTMLTNTGRHISPEQAHQLIAEKKDDFIIFDARNNFESRIGSFEGAITPDINHFRELPAYIDAHSNLFKDKDVLMYCTGGIRCEKATAYLQQKNIARSVAQLEGGICRYTEQFPQGFFKGKNYVFDARVALPVTEHVLTTCFLCASSCDEYTHCLRASCNKQYIACLTCIKRLKNTCCATCYIATFTDHEKMRSPFIKVNVP